MGGVKSDSGAWNPLAVPTSRLGVLAGCRWPAARPAGVGVQPPWTGGVGGGWRVQLSAAARRRAGRESAYAGLTSGHGVIAA